MWQAEACPSSSLFSLQAAPPKAPPPPPPPGGYCGAEISPLSPRTASQPWNSICSSLGSIGAMKFVFQPEAYSPRASRPSLFAGLEPPLLFLESGGRTSGRVRHCSSCWWWGAGAQEAEDAAADGAGEDAAGADPAGPAGGAQAQGQAGQHDARGGRAGRGGPHCHGA